MKRKLYKITHASGQTIFVVADNFQHVARCYEASKQIEYIGEVVVLATQ